MASGSASRSKRRRARAASIPTSLSSVTCTCSLRRSVLPGSSRSANRAGPPGRRSVRAKPVASAASMPGIARSAIQRSVPLRSNGSRTGRTRCMEPGAGVGPRRRARSSVGVMPKTSRSVSLHCLMLPKPAENATSAIVSSVLVSSSRAECARWERARASGPAPSSSVSRRVRCRGEYPSRAESACTPSRSTTPSAMSRIALPTVSCRTFHSGDPGTASGRQRLHAR